MTKIPIWLDCDPGHDDLAAILLSLFNPSFQLIGISTSYGNSSIENTTYNALSILTALHKVNEIPVYAGSSRPLVKPVAFAPDIHGMSGLDGTNELPVPKVGPRVQIDDEKGLNIALYEAVEACTGLTIVAVGPLTNMAKFFRSYPDAKEKIKSLSVMGGSFDGVYNRGYSEFNIWCDPHAADYIVSDAVIGPKLIMTPLNVTHKVICNEKVQKSILNAPNTTKLRKIFHELMMFFAATYAGKQGFKSGPPVHDPVAVFALLDENGERDIGMKYKLLKLRCVTEGEEDGKLEYCEDKDHGSKVVFSVDINAFWDSFLGALKRADEFIEASAAPTDISDLNKNLFL